MQPTQVLQASTVIFGLVMINMEITTFPCIFQVETHLNIHSMNKHLFRWLRPDSKRKLYLFPSSNQHELIIASIETMPFQTV